VGEPVSDLSPGLLLGAGCFSLRSGTFKKSPCSVFVCPESDPPSLNGAIAAVKRLKTLRHPSVVTFLDSAEVAEKSITLATESVTPLLHHLKSVELDQNQEYLAWGILQVFKAVGFLHEVGLVHGSVHAGSVFVTPGLEWKIFGFERTTQKGSALNYGSSQLLAKYKSPESVESTPTATPAGDVWGLGCVIWEVFNGQLDTMSQLGRLGNIPKKLAPTYMELVAKSPVKRPDPKAKVEQLSKPAGYFKNDLIDTMTFLEEFQIKDEAEKSRFFSSLTNKLDSYPPDLCTNKILPELIKMFDFSNAGAQILPPVFKIGKLLSSEDYQEKIVPCLVKLFSSNDRNARYKLLCQLENFVEHLSSKIVNDQVFPQIQNGFMDQQPIIREKTVIAVIHLAPKLTFANLDEIVVMKNFARLLRDEQPGIRTNTTVCLGKVAKYLHYTTRQKVLASAFGGKLKDPFPPARIAAVNALAATQQFYTLQETSARVVPMLCTLLTDPEKPVRDQAFKVAKGFIEKLEQVSEDPALKEEMEAQVTSAASGNASGSVSNWASWAVGAIGAKFYKSSIKPPALAAAATAASPTSGSQQGQQVQSQTPGGSSKESPSSSLQSQANKTGGGPLKLNSPTTDLASLEGGGGKGGDGWNDDGFDNDDDAGWESFEQAVTNVKLETTSSKSASSSKTSDMLIDWGEPTTNSSSSQAQKSDQSTSTSSSLSMPKNASLESSSGWDDWAGDSSGSKLSSNNSEDERKRQREEKRLARQKELEAKRAARKNAGVGGAMKLGSKLS